MDLNNILEMLNDIEPYLKEDEHKILIRKVLTRFLQDEGCTQSNTLKELNNTLEGMDKQLVTVGCVKQHWKQLSKSAEN
ncbi:hypothetical protein [Sporosarcina psychrophila]|uniref:Uncharacterized protein n=1 Tax=Sporosarcina psychrophila TaxID=1476 RepID=A0ABV2KEU8_SPOPS